MLRQQRERKAEESGLALPHELVMARLTFSSFLPSPAPFPFMTPTLIPSPLKADPLLSGPLTGTSGRVGSGLTLLYLPVELPVRCSVKPFMAAACDATSKP